MKKYALAFASAAAISSAPAFAQDDSWTGPYVGLGLGVAQSNTDASASVTGAGSGDVFHLQDFDGLGIQTVASLDAVANANLGQDKVFGTIEAGYDFQVGSNFVIGAFANFDYSFSNRGKNSKRNNLNSLGSWNVGEHVGVLVDPEAADLAIDKSSPCPVGGDDCTFNYGEWDHGLVDQQASFRTQDTWALGVRAGGLVSDNTLLYVSGGYTQTKLGMDLSATIQPSPHDYVAFGELSADARNFAFGDSQWDSKGGYFIGAGVETKVSSNVSVKLDYRYSDFGSRAIGGSDGFDVVDALETVNVPVEGVLSARDISTHAVRAVVAYRF